MMFVDGENFTLRGQEVVRKAGVIVKEGRYYKSDCFLWFPEVIGSRRIPGGDVRPDQLQNHALRSYYYTSLQGNDESLQAAREALRQLGFTPRVFKKLASQRQSKGVDIALAKDMLSHAFHQHYEVAVLIAGDADYVPLVEEAKRLGKLVYVWFFEQEGLNSELRLASDSFLDLTSLFLQCWAKESAARPAST